MVATCRGLSMGLSVGGLCVLHLGGLHWHSISDHKDVLAVPVRGGVSISSSPVSIIPTSVPVSVVPSSVAALRLSDSGKVSGLSVCHFGGIGGNDSSVRGVSLSLGDSGKVHGLGMGYFCGIDNSAIGSKRSVRVHWGVSVDGGICVSGQSAIVSSKVLGFGSLYLGCIQWDSVVNSDGGAIPGRALVNAMSETSMGSKVLCLGGSNLRCVLGNSSDGGVGSQMGSTGMLDFGGINWDAVVANHNRRCNVVHWGCHIMDWGISPRGTVGQRSRVEELRLV